MTPAEFQVIAQLVKQRSGLALTEDKMYLVESRLMPVAQRHGLGDLARLVQRVRTPGADAVIADVVEAMTTNETFFFRDKTPFDHFEKVILPSLIPARAAQKSLRIWCAAASTGQEPYSLAMIIKEKFPQLKDWKIDIIGTDISKEVLAKARAGNYTQFEVQRGLPIQLLIKYFKQEGQNWNISDDIKKMVQYRSFNLLDGYLSLGNFDVVFCRNVLIYFDRDTKADVLKRIAERLSGDGFLLLGAAETVIGVSDRFQPAADARGLYVKAIPAAKAAGAAVAVR
ncbi:MAG TPA: protein-glutamate O-methyltransferase [Micropepsaceae bacterium]|nr:protein-glutamate O-methyltransferase [Micropepsaceae bacterium]